MFKAWYQENGWMIYAVGFFAVGVGSMVGMIVSVATYWPM